MKGRELKNLGLNSTQIKIAQELCREAASDGWHKRQMREAIVAIVADPDGHTDHEKFAKLAEAISTSGFEERDEPAPWQQWGEDLDEKSIQQMANACRLPVARRRQRCIR